MDVAAALPFPAPHRRRVMNASVTHVAILGSTGSIGRSTLEVIDGSAGRMVACGLTAHSRLGELRDQAIRYRPKWLVATEAARAATFSWTGLPSETELLLGPDAVERMVSQPEIDVVVAAIVGSAGLRGTWAALEAGKRVALANKETLVMAGPQVMELAASAGRNLVASGQRAQRDFPGAGIRSARSRSAGSF